MVNVQIINRSPHQLPAYATALSAGVDLRAFLSAPLILGPMERSLVSTGIYVALPPGTEAQIRPRSGMAFKQGVTVLNSPGTIDADYRGEVKVLLVNLSAVEVIVNDGDRIAQMVVARYEQVQFTEVATLNETQRGSGGFGSTGTND